MTICIAAIAADSKAIVCVSDKALSYGEYIQWDADSSKMLSLEDRAAVMFSGSEEGISKVLCNISSCEAELGSNAATTSKLFEENYQSAMDEVIQARYLNPLLLKREEYIAAISGSSMNEYMRTVAEEIRQFNMNCNLLVCGFDSNGDPYILNIDHPGLAVEMTNIGFHAIGGGWDKAISRMLWSDYKRSSPIERVLYDAFDAKANAELAVGVGFKWDAAIILPNRMPLKVSEEIKDLIESVWDEYTRSPFEKWNPKTDAPPLPKSWKAKLRKYFADITADTEPSSG
jgi:hypothetical protein